MLTSGKNGYLPEIGDMQQYFNTIVCYNDAAHEFVHDVIRNPDSPAGQSSGICTGSCVETRFIASPSWHEGDAMNRVSTLFFPTHLFFNQVKIAVGGIAYYQFCYEACEKKLGPHDHCSERNIKRRPVGKSVFRVN